MTNVVKYTSKATAKRGIVRAGVAADVANQFITVEGDDVQVDMDAVKAHVEAAGRADAPAVLTEDDQRYLEQCGHVHCPDCGIHLSNGLSDFEGIVERTESLEDAVAAQGHAWSCMGCGHEWGEEITIEIATERYKGPARKYENKSTVTGAVALVHEIAASMPDARRKDVIQACVDKGIAFYTARSQYQKWFKAKKSAQGLAKR